jgi:hypothetical protein
MSFDKPELHEVHGVMQDVQVACQRFVPNGWKFISRSGVRRLVGRAHARQDSRKGGV